MLFCIYLCVQYVDLCGKSKSGLFIHSRIDRRVMCLTSNMQQQQEHNKQFYQIIYVYPFIRRYHKLL